jgi:hypothetical protein
MAPHIAPYGSWISPIKADDVFAKFVGIGGIQINGDSLYWIESRPDGRNVIVCRSSDRESIDITPQDFNVRTRVHEYGGGDYLATGSTIYFSNFSDQRIYRQVPGSDPQGFSRIEGMRYADSILDNSHGRIIAVREDHTARAPQAVNTLVSINTAGDYDERILVSGNDFYSTPRLNLAETKLAWLTWNHPNMPWDGTELWVGEILPDGSVVQSTLVAGGLAESIFQPQWSPDGVLYFVSDRTGWWNLYRWNEQQRQVESLYPMEGEFGVPQWLFGLSTYDFASAEKLICAFSQNGEYHLASIDLHTLDFHQFDLPYTYFTDLHVSSGQAFFIDQV